MGRSCAKPDSDQAVGTPRGSARGVIVGYVRRGGAVVRVGVERIPMTSLAIELEAQSVVVLTSQRLGGKPLSFKSGLPAPLVGYGYSGGRERDSRWCTRRGFCGLPVSRIAYEVGYVTRTAAVVAPR